MNSGPLQTLKCVNHPASFGSSKLMFEMFVLILGCGFKDIQPIQRESRLKSYFPSSEFILPAWISKFELVTQCYCNVNIIQSLFFIGSASRENWFRIFKSFLGGNIYLYVLNILATAAPKLEQRISKPIFWFKPL